VELEYGVAKSSFPERNKLALVQFLAPFEILPFSETAAAVYSKIRSDLEKNVQIIGPYDFFHQEKAPVHDGRGFLDFICKVTSFS
jgi:tRNA(fMet)-specific endonuclease VapC